MAVAAIVIGAISFNDFDITKIAEVQSNTSCAGAPNIPYYLVIMGILLLSLLILKLFFQVKKNQSCERNVSGNTGSDVIGITTMTSFVHHQ